MKKRLSFLPFVLFSVLLIAGCKLSITAFTAPDTAETGEIITLTFSGQAVDEGDNTGEYGIVLQIPESWGVMKAVRTRPIIGDVSIREKPDYAALYTAESGYKVWVGTCTENGTGNYPVTATVKVLTGSFSGTVQSFNVKAIAGAFRNGGWTSDDPRGIFNFASVSDDKYVESLTVTKVTDQSPPAQVNLSLIDPYSGTDVLLYWNGYDEESQKDVVEYRIYQSSAAFSDTTGMSYIQHPVSRDKSYPVSGLTYGNTYYFAVSAVDEVPNGNKSVLAKSVTLQRKSGSMTGKAYYHSLLCFPGLPCDSYGIEGARITVSKFMFPDISATGTSDAEGNYTISDLPVGRYSVRVEKEEYQTRSYTAEVLENETVNVNDNPMSLKTYPVSGYIRKSDNTGIEAVSLNDISGKTWAITDASGYYSFLAGHGADLHITPVRGGYTFNPASFISGNITSDMEQNFAASVNNPSFVSRRISCYLPGTAATVTLTVNPGNAVSDYKVEENLSAGVGWTVSNISHNGVYDADNHKIIFGPFSDKLQKKLTYQITAASGNGRQLIDGTAYANGNAAPISGDLWLTPCHPADINPKDSALTEDEITAYGNTWKSGNNIDISYLSRAGFLMKDGGTYSFDDSPGKNAPLWWLGSTTGPGDEIPSGSSAVRQMQSVYVPGESLTVSITVNPSANVQAYAVEESPPSGWMTVSDISHGGVYDSGNNRVKFGVFTDNLPRTLTYSVTPPATASGLGYFYGKTSYNGYAYDITGNNKLTDDTFGDADTDRNVDLKDLILVLKVLSGDTVSGISADADVNNDQAVGLPEALYILQKVAGLR